MDGTAQNSITADRTERGRRWSAFAVTACGMVGGAWLVAISGPALLAMIGATAPALIAIGGTVLGALAALATLALLALVAVGAAVAAAGTSYSVIAHVLRSKGPDPSARRQRRAAAATS